MNTRKYELKLTAEKTPFYAPVCDKSECTIFWITNKNCPSSLPASYAFYTKTKLHGFVLSTDVLSNHFDRIARPELAIYEKSNRILVLLLCAYRRKLGEL